MSADVDVRRAACSHSAAVLLPRNTPIITEVGQSEPGIRISDVVSGVVKLQLTEYPVFIEALVP
jgi:hypothetical protein